MVWSDRNLVWRKVEVALVEQHSGELREGLVGGRGVWRVRAQALAEAVEEWLASNASATDQAVRDLEGGVEPSAPLQNPAELTALVSATRTSAVLAAEAASRCATELVTLEALRLKLMDTEFCKMCPAGSTPVLQTRWHVLGECGHSDLRDARVKAAKELQGKAREIFTKKIKDKEGRLPHWWLLFAISADDKWIWPPSEQGVDARSGWQETQWWGLWGPKRLDEWATAYEREFKAPVKARAWATLIRALQALGWAALAECKKVWKVFCKLRAGESAEVAATAKQVAARARQQRWRETELLRAGTRESKRARAAADKERARRLREELDPTRPDRPKGWSRRVPDRAVLQWGAKRDFIRRLHNAAPRLAVAEKVLSAVRVLLTRSQKKRKRRKARRDAAANAQPEGSGAELSKRVGREGEVVALSA
jgi:hypothetical protein